MSLSKKIVGAFLVLGLVAVVMVGVFALVDRLRESAAAEERVMLDTLLGVQRISAAVKSGILTRDETYAIAASRAALAVDAHLDALTGDDAGLRKQFQDYFANVVAITSVFLENRVAEGEKRLADLRTREQGIDEAVQARLSAVSAERERLARLVHLFQGLVVLASIAGILAAGYFVNRSIVRPVGEMRALLQDIAHGEGDLTVRLIRQSNDEIGDIAEAFNTMVGKLRDIMRIVIDTSRQVAEQAEALAVMIEQTAAATARQSESAAATAAAVEQVTVSIGQVADHSRDAEAVSVDADALANSGRDTAAATAEQAAATARAVEEAASHVNALSARSEQIRSIVGVIREIADQTNLLALNAAIEAARAGEQGRGFAVVADEVRKLAERTTSATGDIATMIDAIGNDIAKAVGIIHSGSAQQAKGVAAAESLRDMLGRIGGAVDRSAERTRDIAAATREQASAAESMARHVENIARMAEEISAAAGNSNASARALRELANRLNGEVCHFRV
jgi:methyl-accepting chemotaxis protein